MNAYNDNNFTNIDENQMPEIRRPQNYSTDFKI